jgi:hypothetical protein
MHRKARQLALTLPNGKHTSPAFERAKREAAAMGLYVEPKPLLTPSSVPATVPPTHSGPKK